MPQAPLSRNLLEEMVSNRPPEIVIPVPVGPSPAVPEIGTLGLLLLSTRFWVNTQHMLLEVVTLVAPGHRPFWGGGGSPVRAVLVSNPSLLSSKTEFLIVIWPPEFVPEYPSALFSIQAGLMVTLQARLQAPTYMPESEKLLA